MAEAQDGLQDKLVLVNRVAKTVKGGRIMSFAALSVVGDGDGRVGFGTGKAREVPTAVQKSIEAAKKTMIKVPLRRGTLPHPVEAKFGGTLIFMKPAAPGTGIIAGGAMRAALEVLGIKDVLAKVYGSRNPYNVIQATMAGLSSSCSARDVAQRRNRALEDLGLRKPRIQEEEAGIEKDAAGQSTEEEHIHGAQ